MGTLARMCRPGGIARTSIPTAVQLHPGASAGALRVPTSIIGASGQVQPVPIAMGTAPGGAAGADPGRRPPVSAGGTSIRFGATSRPRGRLAPSLPAGSPVPPSCAAVCVASRAVSGKNSANPFDPFGLFRINDVQGHNPFATPSGPKGLPLRTSDPADSCGSSIPAAASCTRGALGAGAPAGPRSDRGAALPGRQCRGLEGGDPEHRRRQDCRTHSPESTQLKIGHGLCSLHCQCHRRNLSFQVNRVRAGGRVQRLNSVVVRLGERWLALSRFWEAMPCPACARRPTLEGGPGGAHRPGASLPTAVPLHQVQPGAILEGDRPSVPAGLDPTAAQLHPNATRP